MSQGLKIVDPVTKKDVFNSTNPRLQVAVNRNPAHIQRITSTPTAIVTNAGNNFEAREVLFEMKHNLGYKPKVLIYFSQPSSNNAYNLGKFFFGFGAIDDFLEYEIDEAWFRVVHRVSDYFNAGFTSIAQGNVTFKFMIFSNPINKVTDPNRRT